MSNSYWRMLVVAIALTASTTTGCKSTMSYKPLTGDLTSPEDKILVFSLRNSTILISSVPDKKPDDAKKSEGAPANDLVSICSDTKPTGAAVLTTCLTKVTAKAVASRAKSTVYAADPGYGTTVQSTAVDDDPFMVKSVAINYKNPAVGIITGIGTGAAAGFEVGGPWGAALGGVLGGVGGAIEKEMIVPPAVAGAPWFQQLVCEKDRTKVAERQKDLQGSGKKAPELVLPITLDYNTANSLSQDRCWHPLPNKSEKANTAAMLDSDAAPRLSGWFYRIIPGSKKEEGNLPPVLPSDVGPKQKGPLDPWFQKKEDYFKDQADKTTFPVSACRAVEVQITWWELIDKHYANQKKEKLEFYRYPLMVADSGYVQTVRIPKNGNIYLLPVCGGYESSTQLSSSVGDFIDAAVKQVQAVKEAQWKYEGANK